MHPTSRGGCLARLLSPGVCTQRLTQGSDRRAAPVRPAAAPAPRARQHAVYHGPFPAPGAALPPLVQDLCACPVAHSNVKQEASPLLDPRVLRAVLPATAAAAGTGTALPAPPSSCGRCTHSLQTKLSVMEVESKCTSIILTPQRSPPLCCVSISGVSSSRSTTFLFPCGLRATYGGTNAFVGVRVRGAAAGGGEPKSGLRRAAPARPRAGSAGVPPTPPRESPCNMRKPGCCTRLSIIVQGWARSFARRGNLIGFARAVSMCATIKKSRR